MDIKDIFPKSKDDIYRASRLKNYSFIQLKPFSIKLLSYLLDMNWPVANFVADYLRPHLNELVNEITEILRSDDNMWKYWIIVALIDKVDYEINPILLNELHNLANYPSLTEKNSEVDLVAQEALKKIY